MTRLPDDFLKHMACLLGGEAEALVRALEEPGQAGLRVNTLKVSADSFCAMSPFPLERIPWLRDGYIVLDGDARPALHPYHFAGLYYLQDPSAMLAAELLDPQPGQWVLDLCAAPGGKSTHLAARMKNRGVLVCNDPHPDRVTVLARNLERLGVTCAAILQEQPRRLARRLPGMFDRVLVDAPCSGESTLGLDSDARRRWSRRAVASLSALQREILHEAAYMVRPGGYLLYATCTFSPEENEDVVVSFLTDHPEFDIEELPGPSVFDRGRPEWVSVSPADRALVESVIKAIRLWPHRGQGRGHFYALLRRKQSPGVEILDEGVRGLNWQGDRAGCAAECSLLHAFRRFCDDYLEAPLPEGRMIVWDGHLYLVPVDPDLFSGLRVLRPGWWLGSVRRGEFVPDHALAMGIGMRWVRQTISFSSGDPALLSYLRGQELSAKGIEGWVLIGVDGFPLGWALAKKGRLRNFYPRAWRLS